jgi:NADH:ubiquinone oxidoreductase subunit F (NADH-binding)
MGRKWRAIAERGAGPAVVVANGAEGEPRSLKDRLLLAARPHLVIDGAILAADAVGADEIVFYVGEEHVAAQHALARAIAERHDEMRRPKRLVAAPIGYVSGEASAAVHYINAGDARPTNAPPRPSESGVRGRPTLVQNVESLAYASLIGRFGDDWYRTAGLSATRGTALVTISGSGLVPVIEEIQLGATIADVAAATGVDAASARAVLLGGYFGSWCEMRDALDIGLDPAAMTNRHLSFGCGMITFLSLEECGVSITARVIRYMARESAGQCGPCVFGLQAIGDAISRVSAGQARRDDIANVKRWCSVVRGRGACRHPDGAVGMVESALNVFAEDFAAHAATGDCAVRRSRVAVA